MRIMLTGANGQVGWELSRSLLPLGEVIPLTQSQCDLSQPDNLPGIVKQIKPDVIVNAAAYTEVDKAEKEEGLATLINGTSVGVLAEEAKKHNALFVHYSTDYVFDGTKSEPYTEEDTPNPINAYGRSKLVGERTVRKIGGKYLIFRTSWVYSVRGKNFAKTMLRLAKERDELKVVADQFGVPTSAELISDITLLAIYDFEYIAQNTEKMTGTYHLTPTGEISWHGFAKYVISKTQEHGVKLRATPEKIYPISTSEYPLPAMRPGNSRLDTAKLIETFRVHVPPWQIHVDRLIAGLVNSDAMG